jgi:hypothetical protein
MSRPPLLPEQEELLAVMVEASRSVPLDQRQPFLIIECFGGTNLAHGGLAAIGKDDYQPYVGDVKTLASRGLIRLEAINQHSFRADLTPEGVQQYERTKTASGQPIQTVVEDMRTYLIADEFRRRHPGAIAKWGQAETVLWSSDPGPELTTIGHHCREAMQAFATETLGTVGGPEADPDVQHTISRMRTAISARVGSAAVRQLSDTLLSYWGSVHDLVQRQEHGATKEGDDLSWEDARRIVFQTLVVMYEIDRVLR